MALYRTSLLHKTSFFMRISPQGRFSKTILRIASFVWSVNVFRGILVGNVENTWLCETPIRTHLVMSALEKVLTSRNAMQPEYTHLKENGVRPLPPDTIAKKWTRLEPISTTMVSWMIAESSRATSIARRRLAAATTSAGAMENVSESLTVSNDCRKRTFPSATTKSDYASSIARASARRDATTLDM